MTEELKHEISRLIEMKKEGTYWDFKREYHKSTCDLTHDIICLANADHVGVRYLVFGVNNQFQVVGLGKDNNRKTQAQIIDTMKGAHFANGLHPDVHLETLNFEEGEVDVLVIQNTAHKPYYLTKAKVCEHAAKKLISAGTVYTRIMDTNTPKDSVANSNQIEKMWRERFGLTQSVLDKFYIYLNTPSDWDKNNELVYFYKQFPEFTIKPCGDNDYGCHEEEWARGEIGYHYTTGDSTTLFEFYYHSTKLEEMPYCQFDGGKKHIVPPDWEAVGAGRFYFYQRNTLRYRFHQFMCAYRSDHSKGLGKSEMSGCFDIPVLDTQDDLKQFIDYAKKQLGVTTNKPEFNKDEQNRLFYALLDLYDTFINFR